MGTLCTIWPVRQIARIALIIAAMVAAQPGSTGRAWPAALRECTVDAVAERVRCATVRVAESAHLPQGRQIDVRVIVLPAHTNTPALDPVLPLAGGPGQGAATLAPLFARQLAWARATRDLVLVDQRGTGQSNGLHCAAPAALHDLMGRLFDRARVTACRDELSRRADLTQYTTPAAAADYGRVIDALGYRQVNVIGTSYGSRMGLELARRFPRRIRTLTLDGVVPPSAFDWPSSGAPDAEAALDALVRDCAADAACAGAFPRFHQDIDRAFARVAERPVMTSVRDPATGTVARVPIGTTDLAYATRGILYGNAALSLPLWFRDAADGRFDAFAQAYVDRARRLDAEIAHGVHFGVYCAEDLPYVDWPRAHAAAAGTRIGAYLLDQYRAACAVWPTGVVPASYREPVRSAVPALLLSGRRDPVTPPRTAQVAARTLSRSRLLIWRHGGHAWDGLVGRECRVAIQGAFLRTADPDRVPVDCMTLDAVLPFRLPGGR